MGYKKKMLKNGLKMVCPKWIANPEITDKKGPYRTIKKLLSSLGDRDFFEEIYVEDLQMVMLIVQLPSLVINHWLKRFFKDVFKELIYTHSVVDFKTDSFWHSIISWLLFENVSQYY